MQKSIKRNKNMIKTVERKDRYGEVFTPEKTVNKMLNLVSNELSRVDSRFLEPTCGNGNFLIAVLRKKLDYVYKNYGSILYEYEQQLLLALGSIYGVDLLEDNVFECKERLLTLWLSFYKKGTDVINKDVLNSAKYIINRNIIQGNSLLMTDCDGKKLVFSEWAIIKPGIFSRRDFIFEKDNKNSRDKYESKMINQCVVGYRRICENGN